MLNSSLRRAHKEVQLLACIWVIHLPWKSTHYKSETSSYPGISYSTLALQHPHMGFLQPCHPPAFIQQDPASKVDAMGYTQDFPLKVGNTFGVMFPSKTSCFWETAGQMVLQYSFLCPHSTVGQAKTPHKQCSSSPRRCSP